MPPCLHLFFTIPVASEPQPTVCGGRGDFGKSQGTIIGGRGGVAAASARKLCSCAFSVIDGTHCALMTCNFRFKIHFISRPRPLCEMK